MAARKHRLSLDLLTSVPAPSVFTRFRDLEIEELDHFPEIKERAEACLRFAWHMSAGIGIPSEAPPPPNECRKYLRALLAEYVSIEEASSIDLKKINGINSIKITETNDPKLHILRLLRHGNIHLECSSLSPASRDAIWRFKGDDKQFVYNFLIITNLHNTITATEQARKYSSDELEVMIAWLEREQQEWGIDNVIIYCVELYLRNILQAINSKLQR